MGALQERVRKFYVREKEGSRILGKRICAHFPLQTSAQMGGDVDEGEIETHK